MESKIWHVKLNTRMLRWLHARFSTIPAPEWTPFEVLSDCGKYRVTGYYRTGAVLDTDD